MPIVTSPPFSSFPRRLTALFVLALAVGVRSAPAQTPAAPAARRELPATSLSAGAVPPTIDGRVNDDAWQQAAPFSDFTQQDPIEGAPATERTDIRVLFTATHVYIGVICFDDPSRVILSQSRRDASLTETDSVILIFDTFNDNQNAFVFGTNPVGIEYDGQVVA